MGIAFKCVRCKQFFGKPTWERRSRIIVNNEKSGESMTFDVCDNCLDIMIDPLLGLLGASDKQPKIEETTTENISG